MKRKLLSILLVLMLVCFAFPVATAFATEQPEPVSTKTIVAGTDFTLDVSEGSINLDGFTLGKSVGYGGTPNKGFVTILRGESVVLKFKEVIELTNFCVESSLVLLEEGVCYDQCIFLAKLY